MAAIGDVLSLILGIGGQSMATMGASLPGDQGMAGMDALSQQSQGLIMQALTKAQQRDRKKKSGWTKAGSIIGTVAGAASGGVPGAAAGASMGSSLGSMADSGDIEPEKLSNVFSGWLKLGETGSDTFTTED